MFRFRGVNRLNRVKEGSGIGISISALLPVMVIPQTALDLFSNNMFHQQKITKLSQWVLRWRRLPPSSKRGAEREETKK